MNDLPDCFNQKERNARKEHKCFGCGSKIDKGEKYTYTSGVWNGEPNDFKHCNKCMKIFNSYKLFDEHCAIDEGPALDWLGLIDWFQGYICSTYNRESLAKDIEEIFEIDSKYCQKIAMSKI